MPHTATGTATETRTGETSPDSVPRRRWWSRWPDWAGYLAVVWSALYGAAALYWSLGGDAYPFEKVRNDRSSGSLLEPSRAAVVAPALAVFCALGVAAGILMLKNRGTGRFRTALLAYGWTAGIALTFLIPDYSLLGLLVFSPVLLVFAFTGVPGPQDMGDILYWHRGNLMIVFLGGLLWIAATLAHQRRTNGSCAHCGRAPHGGGAGNDPARLRTWGTRAVYLAVLSTLPYDITRIAWYFGWPLGITDAFLKEMQDTPNMLEMGLGLGVLSTLGSLLMHGLVARWGEVWPRWVWFKKGRTIHPATAVIPATVIAVVLVPAGVMAVRAFEAASWGITGPAILWVVWGAALGAATYLYHLRRRGQCRSCARQ
ncbi:NYN domain-containing protein [Streptomyces sp. NBC_00536]|uniref:NYN domain-containing protein n=1 Tax=Streptomyces sp. NBC_00536 TaxID=2975769 RepID=UPI002E80D5E0|nr:NYN domain-containing protein [Streptomyces sp. NBC_00536]WUC79113.1 NYN domain-containing protein [Streptomyces sp. NBC_00536]